MAKRKTKADLDREIESALNSRARYMLVDATTGKDMREAHDFEIAEVVKNSGVDGEGRPRGRAKLLLGGHYGVPQRYYDVKLRIIGEHQPARSQMRNPTLPAETYTAKDRHGNVVATSPTVAGAMSHADKIFRTGDLTVKGEYTSDGHHWGLGKGRVVAQRRNGRWLRG